MKQMFIISIKENIKELTIEPSSLRRTSFKTITCTYKNFNYHLRFC